jgi:amino acid adenylation domain-containing protein/non-ribosomal peptide synthase protein (TIGR01720 family)
VRGIEQTNYSLTVGVVLGEQLSISISYDRSRFDADAIARMLGHLQMLLEGMAFSSEQFVTQLPMLTVSEQQQLLVEWNDTQVDYPRDRCIHELFEQQVELSPDAIAVVFEDRHLTYWELNQQANRLAHHLQELGVQPEVLVGICVERSLDMVVGLLGILKAGGAYVPFDPDYPQERLSFMLSDTQIPVLLTQRHLVDRLPDNDAQVLYVDEARAEVESDGQDWENPVSQVGSKNLAYINYTSGSTGQPKGVEVLHQGVLRLLFGVDYVRLNAEQRILQMAPISFDASTFEIWGALLHGGRCVLLPSKLPTAQELSREIERHDITTMWLTAALFNSIVDEAPETLSGIRQLAIGGEALSVSHVRSALNKLLSTQIVNGYGPTESTTFTCCYPIPCEPHELTTSIPIGRPIGNTEVYLLDAYLQPVPIGVPGELHIGGAGLARGYLNRLELTQEKFVPNPFSDDPQARLYKTGDLVRYLPDGNIEYIDRIDNQVKIRGFRIELGEVENALLQHPAVLQAVAIAREGVPGTKRLVAYTVCDSSQDNVAIDLRQFLKGKLPEYMVPSAFVFLKSLPLTPNGKVDRRNLPAPDLSQQLEENFVAPRTLGEETLVKIWAEVLGIERVGIRDNFFELGGDSILSLQIVARANQAGLQLTPKQLFDNQTIVELAAVAGTAQQIQAEQGLVTGRVPLMPIQQWFFAQTQPEPHHYNQSAMLSVPADLKPEYLGKALQQLISHHDALRLRFEQTETGWEQVNTGFSERVALQVVDLSALPPNEQQSELERLGNELQASLNLSDGVLMRASLFQLGSDKPGRLLLVIHHLAVDGVSWRVLLEDLLTAYQHCDRGETIQLPPKTTSFQDWAIRLADYAQTEALSAEVDYWLDRGGKIANPLPLDCPTGENSVASAATVTVALSATDTHALLHEVPKAYNTQMNDVLLAALGSILRDWAGGSAVLLSLEGHGREDLFEDVDVSRTVGWFTTAFPIVLDLSEAVDSSTALKSIKEQLRSVPNKGMGYGLLRYLRGDAELVDRLQSLPAPEVSFNYLGQFDQTFDRFAGFQLTTETAGHQQSLLGHRDRLLDINGFIVGGQLQIDWTYSANIHRTETIENLSQAFVSRLQELIAHCITPEVGGRTPSDFPLARIPQSELDRLGDCLPSWRQLEDLYPLSPMQQGMLFHSLFAPDSGVYVELLTCTFGGDLNVSAFEQAWQQAVDRHATFRTTFLWQQDQPLQMVSRQLPISVSVLNWQNTAANSASQSLQLERFLESEQQQGFDPSQAPLMRLHLIRLDGKTYQFVWSYHHLLLDGWSLPLLLGEIFDRYDALCTGTTLPSIPTTAYRSYIAWLQQQDMGKARAYWQQKLRGFTAPISLRVERPLRDRQQFSGYEERAIALSSETTTMLQSFARQHQLTLNNLVQGAWAILLSRYSGESDIVFGATVSGRPPELAGVESIVGLFINTLPMRARVESDAELLPWLKELQAQQVEAEQYAYTPLVEIQNWSDVQRGTPLFESIVVFENYPVDASLHQRQGSLEISNVRGVERTNYPLTLTVIPGEQLTVEIGYDISCFNPDTVTRLFQNLQTLLEGIVTDSPATIRELPLLAATEQHQLLVEWNYTPIDYDRDLCIHPIFEEQVERNPDAIAVVWADQHLTYRELNSRANRLARYLQNRGVAAETLVGICLERSLDLVVAILGILKAGGAYIPLDPNYPPERITYMMQDAQVSLLLTRESILTQLPELEVRSICLDRSWQDIFSCSDRNPTISTRPENLAYVIYTSGSTGTPKGVMVRHYSLVNAYWGWENAYQLRTRTHCHLQMASFSFDVFTGDWVRALCSGCKLVLCPREVLSEPAKLYQLMRSQSIDCAEFVPAVVRPLIDYLEQTGQNLHFMRILAIGSDSWYVSEYRKFQRYCDAETRLINSYGVSEATIDSCYFESTALDLPGEALVPIGKPFGNVQLFVLDSFLQPVPIGVPGELHVGGLGLARGYCHRSEMTRERFVDLELPTLGSVHLYKTGDLARFLPDGNLELLGRIDNQVKIRGFRIELGEVETTLLQQPAVSQAIAIAREDEPGMKRLVAYLVCDTEQKPATNDLREFLKQTLPEYMVPSAFVFIEALPLTPNGKIDRRALPAPEFRPDLEPGFIAPETEIEQRLAQIWSEVLGIKQIGIRDNFFALGGDSILSLQIITRANQAKLQLTPKQLFAHPTIAELAAVVGTGSNVRAEQGLVIGAVPLTPIQRWFFEQEQPEPHHYNQSVVLEVPANLKSDLLQRVLQQLTVHHDALRLRFDRADSGWEQRHAEPEEIVPLTVVDLSDRSSAERHAELDRIGNEMQASLNLSVGSLMQAVLFRLGSDVPGRLLLIVHHLAIDGVSWRILLEDLLTAYQQCDCGETIHLPLKTTSFQYWARQLTEYARSNALAAELDYWLEQTDRQFASLPTDHPTGANTVASATTISVFLDTEETQVLLHEVPKAYNTQMNDILLASLVLAINQQTGDRGIRLDLEGHGREDLFDEVDLSRTVGWFTTLFPVVLELEDAASPQDVLKSVKEQLRGIPNKGMGYSLLRYLSPDPSLVTRLRNAPPAEICFNYLGQFEQSLDSASGFRLTTDSFGSAESPHRLRSHLLDINGFIVGDRLQIDWAYSSNLHQAGTIDRLARAFIQQLRSLISHCISPNAGGYTPSDFPLAKLNQVQLDRITFGLHGNSRWQDLEDLYPLSPTQQGMLFHSLLEPDSGVYVELFSCTLRGRLNLPAFERAWRQTIARHTIFRTAFLWQHEQPLQVVYRNIDLPLDVQNWTALTPEVQQRQIEDLLESEGKQGFDLALAPLMRLHLIQLNDEAHQFVWSHHHILLDGWSLPLVLKEVFDRYDAICTDTALPSETAVAYRKYIAWLQQQDANKAQTYWQQKLQGFIAPTPIDVKQPYSDRQPHEGYGAEQLELSSETATALRSFARQHQLTLNNLVQGAWALLLARYSGESDVVFGAVVSGRPPALPDVESMVGMFINTLPMRARVESDTELLSWLKELQAQQVETEQYSYTPLVDIQNWSDVPRGMPLFESIVVFENYPVDASLKERQGTLDVSNVRGIQQTNYPLTAIVVLGDRVSLNISYERSRFDADAIARMLGHLQMLLEGMVLTPVLPISRLPLLTEWEQQQLLVDWNDTQADYPRDLCVHQLFERQVERTPDAVAIVSEDEQLTYKELDRQANQLARHLQALGVRPEVPVGICIERSLDMAIGLLAILKAGGAYVPLDPNYPQERLSFMLSDSQVPVLLTQTHLIEILPAHSAQIVCLDAWEAIARSNTAPCDSGVKPDNLAYVLYTSGSTGKPKGVAIEHRSPVALVSWAREIFTPDRLAGVLASTSICFDLSVFELFVPLCCGGAVILAENALQLPTLSTADRVTLINTVPSAITELLRVNGIPQGVKTVNLAGEPLPIQLVQQLYQQDSIQQVFNLYGPSEDTTYSTFAAIVKGAATTPPIGRPITNTQTYILDRNLQPLPIGVPGELHVGGDGLAREYLNRPELTKEKFIPNPFSFDPQSRPKSRLYKTGDLARYLPDGISNTSDALTIK